MNDTSISILTIGDPHFKISNPRETEEMHAKILVLIRERRPDHVVILGDTLDRHELIHVSPQTRAIKFIYDIAREVSVTLLIGNHDLKNNQQFLSEEHPFYALRETKLPIRVVDSVTKFSVGSYEFAAAPYVPPGKFREALSILGDYSNVAAIFAHQEFAGAQMGAVVSTEGDKWSELDPYVISGHIHDFQELPGVCYTGTPIQHTFDDSDLKTVSWWQWTGSSEEGNRTHERINLGCKRKKIVRLTTDEVMLYLPETNTDTKIKVSGTAAQIATVMKHPNVKLLRSLGHKVVPGTTIVVGTETPTVMLSGPVLSFSQAMKEEVARYQGQYERLEHWFNKLMPQKT